MTPKEEAKQLYEKMKFLTEFNSQPSTVHGMCKKLALVCVDEVIQACEYNNVETYNTDWWLKVKEEIQNL